MSLLSILLTLGLQGALPQQQLIVAVQTVRAETVKVFANKSGGLTVQSANKAALTFYLFDLEGTLLYQSTIKQHESKTIEGLTKGTYLYTAFQNDESIEEGKVTLK